jgi:glycyl-tRNA synthetase beta chain
MSLNNHPSQAKPLLIELLTEELPPKSLNLLSQSFGEGISHALQQQGLVEKSIVPQLFASPRRLAVRVSNVWNQAADREVFVKGPSLSIAFDTENKPTLALTKWCEKQGVSQADININKEHQNPKEHHVWVNKIVKGFSLESTLPAILEQVCSKLPISKMMRWGDTDYRFVRPVHGLTALHGDQLISLSLFGKESTRFTLGHRFMSIKNPIELKDADSYEAQLQNEGMVMVCSDSRKSMIQQQLAEQANAMNLNLGQDKEIVESLLNEVCALVEYPQVYTCEFEKKYLSVPQECLILTMRTNQKYFPLFDHQNKLSEKFLVVSNMKIADPKNIIEGNQRVIRPRLSDAQFFYESDLKIDFSTWRETLNRVIYHNQLGSQGDRLVRLQQEATRLYPLSNITSFSLDEAKTVLDLCKLDLMSGMVGEFPELQGVMGRYYALHKGIPTVIANAIESHYQPRSAADNIAEDDVGRFVAFIDRVEMLRSFWHLGLQPTGDKDPFGMRRAALGVVRILLETPWQISLAQMLSSDDLQTFVLERLRGYLKDKYGDRDADVVEAVMSCAAHQPLVSLTQRITALIAFKSSSAAASLASAHKRMSQILKKNQIDTRQTKPIQPALLLEPSEQALFNCLSTIQNTFGEAMYNHDFATALQLLSQIKEPMDAFFDQVMVMADDLNVRENRLSLLVLISQLMEQVADLGTLN